MLEVAERSVRAVGGIAALSVLALAVFRMLRAVRLPAARQETHARWLLRPARLLAATAAFVGAGVVLWRPLPLEVGSGIRAVSLAAGALLHFGGLSLYLFGMRSLGEMFAPSSGFGVRLQAPRRLVTSGAFGLMRHPMYLGVILTSLGVLLLYRTWAALALAIMMFGLIARARREDKLLASEFGEEWSRYAALVAGWIPRFRRRDRGRASAVLVSADAYERTQYENELLRVLARGDAEAAAGLGRDADDVMAEARALFGAE